MRSVADIHQLLEELDSHIADDLEDTDLDFKEWNIQSMADSVDLVIKMAVCMANGGGGTVVFGVADSLIGRGRSIKGIPLEIDTNRLKRAVYDSTDPKLMPVFEDVHVPEGTGRLLEGQYPDFRRFLPTEYPSMVILERERLISACERCALVAPMGAVQLGAGPEGVCLTARRPEVGAVTERFSGEVYGPAFAVPINANFVLGGLRSMMGERVIVEFAGGRQAVRFRSGRSADSFFAVLPLLSF